MEIVEHNAPDIEPAWHSEAGTCPSIGNFQADSDKYDNGTSSWVATAERKKIQSSLPL